MSHQIPQQRRAERPAARSSADRAKAADPRGRRLTKGAFLQRKRVGKRAPVGHPWRIVNRNKRTTVAAVAIARELAGVIWAQMQEPAEH